MIVVIPVLFIKNKTNLMLSYLKLSEKIMHQTHMKIFFLIFNSLHTDIETQIMRKMLSIYYILRNYT